MRMCYRPCTDNSYAYYDGSLPDDNKIALPFGNWRALRKNLPYPILAIHTACWYKNNAQFIFKSSKIK
ncbi:hypothetical protein YSY43_06290 [Paenibacillus sp. YSY-4.3]